jgi:hypothetical protein
MSVSKEAKASLAFGKNSSYPIYIKIEHPKSAKDISPFGFLEKKFEWQQELLYTIGASFKVKNLSRIDVGGKTAYSITLEENNEQRRQQRTSDVGRSHSFHRKQIFLDRRGLGGRHSPRGVLRSFHNPRGDRNSRSKTT